MKIKFGAIIVDGSGKIGGHFVSKNKGSVSLRTSNHKKHQVTELQQLRRYAYSALSIQWRALSSADKDYYVRSAPKGLTGFNYYISLFINQFKLTTMLTSTIKITGAELISKTIRPLIPACGAGKYINVFGFSGYFKPGSTPFASDNVDLSFDYNNSGYGVVQFRQNDGDNYANLFSSIIAGTNSRTLNSGSVIENGYLSVQQQNTITNGNGSFVITVSYSIEDII